MEMNNIKNAFIGDGTGKIKTFAVLTVENAFEEIEIRGRKHKRLKSAARITPFLRLQPIGRKDIKSNSDTFVLFNPALSEVMEISSKLEVKSFFFVNNEFPATVTCYQAEENNTYRKADSMENITDVKTAEEFFARCGMAFKSDSEKIVWSVEKYCENIINIDYPRYISMITSENITESERRTARLLLGIRGVSEDYSIPALLGDNKGKVMTFAFPLMSDEESSDIICNITYDDALGIASRAALKSFFFVKNALPASVTYYKSDYDVSENSNGIIPVNTYNEVKVSGDITDIAEMERFFSECECETDMESLKKAVDDMCSLIVNEDYPHFVSVATDIRMNPDEREYSRRRLERKDFDERRKH